MKTPPFWLAPRRSLRRLLEQGELFGFNGGFLSTSLATRSSAKKLVGDTQRTIENYLEPRAMREGAGA